VRCQAFSLVCLLCASPAYAQTPQTASPVEIALGLFMGLGLLALVVVLIKQALRPGALTVAIMAQLMKTRRSWKESVRQARERADR
jgi:hypothetical protein